MVNGNGNGKGKDRTNPKDEDSNSSQGASVLSRVKESASGLAQSAFANPNHNEINAGVAAALSNSRKTQPSNSGSPSTWAESSTDHKPHPHSARGNAFNVGHGDQHVGQAEDEFLSFLDGIDSVSSVPSDIVGIGHLNGGELRADLADAWERSQHTNGISPSSKLLHRTVAEQEYHDGHDVFAMLNQPSELHAPFEAPQEDHGNYDWGLSSKQLSQLQSITKELFPSPAQHTSISPDNLFNLLPQYGDIEDHRTQYDALGKAVEVLGADVINPPPNSVMYNTVSAINKEQWEGVLTRYADEVWGELLPLVKEARLEIEGIPNEGSPGIDQGKALRRLGAILGHLQNR